MSGTSKAMAAADAAAAAASAAAGVRVRELTGLAEIEAACRLFDEIWRPEPANPAMTTDLMRALGKAGNYVAGAFDAGPAGAPADSSADGRLAGACVGFFGPPADQALHSHLAGVSAAALGRGVGFALKLHQRAWALSRDVAEIAWTFDPLVRRNAHFNLVKLGARPAEYLTNFYGGINDAINGADETDRLLVRWQLRAPGVAAACAGKPSPASAAAELARGAREALSLAADGWPVSRTDAAVSPGHPVLLAVPADIERLRARDPACAAAWRTALRDALAPAMARALVTGFDKAGWYVLESAEETHGTDRG